MRQLTACQRRKPTLWENIPVCRSRPGVSGVASQPRRRATVTSPCGTGLPALQSRRSALASSPRRAECPRTGSAGDGVFLIDAITNLPPDARCCCRCSGVNSRQPFRPLLRQAPDGCAVGAGTPSLWSVPRLSSQTGSEGQDSSRWLPQPLKRGRQIPPPERSLAVAAGQTSDHAALRAAESGNADPLSSRFWRIVGDFSCSG